MTDHDYTQLQIRREIIAADIRHALARGRGSLRALYAEAARLAAQSLRAEIWKSR